MTQDQEQHPSNKLPQVYDTSLKEGIFQQAPAILPLLLPAASYEQTLTVEQTRPTVCMNKFFKIMHTDKNSQAKLGDHLRVKLDVSRHANQPGFSMISHSYYTIL